jgi:hypothetical protein
LPVAAEELREAADALAGARDAWLALTRLWEVITTDTQDAVSPVTVDASDLVLRMGRLVFGDARWTPAWREPGQTDGRRLAPGQADLRMTLAAVHHSIDAIGFVAHADADGVAAAGQADRLYMPARILGDIDAGSRPYRTAPADRVFVLRCAYQNAVDSTERAARMMDTLAVRCGTASNILGLMRATAPASVAGPELRMRPDVLAVALRSFDRPEGSHRGHADVDEQVIVRAYVEDGLTIRQCSFMFLIDPAKVSAILQANGVRPGADRGRDAGMNEREAGPRPSRRRAAQQREPADGRRVIPPPAIGASQSGQGQAPSPRA